MKNITFINAGAGSGKTYRLTTELARRLTQAGLDPSQVILTTYTELAAAEFREKARKEILNAKDKDNNPIDANIRIKNATQLDNAFIGTVHAISYRFIKKYWYLLGYGADIQPMSDQNQDFYMSQSISSIVTEEDRKVFREFRELFNIKENNIVVFPNGNWVTNKIYYNSQKDEYKVINPDAIIDSNTITKNNEITSKKLQISNDIILYDLIKNETDRLDRSEGEK
jgi:superfamily I DNA/RNA helicase